MARRPSSSDPILIPPYLPEADLGQEEELDDPDLKDLVDELEGSCQQVIRIWHDSLCKAAKLGSIQIKSSKGLIPIPGGYSSWNAFFESSNWRVQAGRSRLMKLICEAIDCNQANLALTAQQFAQFDLLDVLEEPLRGFLSIRESWLGEAMGNVYHSATGDMFWTWQMAVRPVPHRDVSAEKETWQIHVDRARYLSGKAKRIITRAVRELPPPGSRYSKDLKPATLRPELRSGLCEVRDAKFRSIIWYGKEFTLTELQGKVVEVLWEEWQQSGPALHGDEIRTRINNSKSEIRNIFKRNPIAWAELIDRPEKQKGFYQLKVPEKHQDG